MDIEELVGVAVTQDACAYYGSRTAAPLAELIVMPYTSLLHKETRCTCARVLVFQIGRDRIECRACILSSTVLLRPNGGNVIRLFPSSDLFFLYVYGYGTSRDSLGIELKGNVIVLDEAHNIIETINSVHSARVSSDQVHDAQSALSAYLDRYRHRLKGKNLVYVKQILHVLKQLHRFFHQQERNFVASTEQPSSSKVSSSNLSGSRCTRDSSSSSSSVNSGKNSSSGNSKVQKKIYTINGLLFELGIDNLNLLKLER